MSNLRSPLRGLSCFLWITVAIPELLFLALVAQVSTADIVGTVTDASNAVVAGVKVRATNLATDLTYVGASNASGEFTIPLLPAGHYKIEADIAGFKSWTVPDVALTIGERLRVSPRLEVGTMGQSVEVSAEVAALQTDSATIGTIVDQKQVDDLPLNGRNFLLLAQIVPGANNYGGGSFANGGLDDRRRNTTISANGRFGAENNFLIDGMDNNEKFIGTVLVKPSMEAVGEMKVLTNTFSAELARTSGAAVVIVTRGGGNHLHGSAFEYIR
ncbi:MAG TPA: carboxypeptidase-like regulatory domain-containing protein, partial [Bryobacteraceae bacterium]|nr:carboxypeptidase-like regulatory domain-containing protein [Bryobacteraceae bacterium]